MRDFKTAKKELRFLEKISEEFLVDYEYALSQEDLSKTSHDIFLQRIGDVYSKYKDLQARMKSIGALRS